MSLEDKIATVAREIYGADGVTYSAAAKKELKRIADMGMSSFPVCMAKTQYSLSDDQTKLGRPNGFTINVRGLRIGRSRLCRCSYRFDHDDAGLSKNPAAYGIDVNDDGVITGLF